MKFESSCAGARRICTVVGGAGAKGHHSHRQARLVLFSRYGMSPSYPNFNQNRHHRPAIARHSSLCALCPTRNCATFSFVTLTFSTFWIRFATRPGLRTHSQPPTGTVIKTCSPRTRKFVLTPFFSLRRPPWLTMTLVPLAPVTRLTLELHTVPPNRALFATSYLATFLNAAKRRL